MVGARHALTALGVCLLAGITAHVARAVRAGRFA